jgi:nicotinate dehydrogenase subunit A
MRRAASGHNGQIAAVDAPLASMAMIFAIVSLRHRSDNAHRSIETGKLQMVDQLALRVNGRNVSVSAAGDTPLLYVLRNDLGLNGPKFGCGLSQCGACAVLKDGVEIRSCVTPVTSVVGHEITTSEGVEGSDKLRPLYAAFVAEQVPQCGYCTSGMVIAAAALLKKNPRPSPAEIKAGMNGHLCRCATHLRVVRAIQRAVREGVQL